MLVARDRQTGKDRELPLLTLWLALAAGARHGGRDGYMQFTAGVAQSARGGELRLVLVLVRSLGGALGRPAAMLSGHGRGRRP